MNRDPICALCTPPGTGALSVIRLAGKGAVKIARSAAPFLPGELEGRRSYIGEIRDGKRPVDHVVITYFEEGKSFTGEETFEISCHGGRLIFNDILQLLVSCGARPARRGEFSLRAFLNGKMDLTQAEGLLQLIESESDRAKQNAFYQLRGRFSKELRVLEERWLELLGFLEADIDFSQEGLELLDRRRLEEKLEDLILVLKSLLSRYHPFENLQKGMFVGIFGPVNVGKSTLFNRLLGEERSIVTGEEGTTRDVVEGALRDRDFHFTLQDTAGFREAEGPAEQLGQKKSRELFDSVDFRLLVLDGTDPFPLKMKEFFGNPRTGIVWTKKDLCSKEQTLESLISGLKDRLGVSAALFEDISKNCFFVSSLTGEGIESLKDCLAGLGQNTTEDFLITNQRHFEKLKLMKGALEKAFRILKQGAGERDLMALELREGLLALYEITGKQLDDRILDDIFKRFCIGK